MNPNQDKLTYPHTHFEVTTRINELIDMIQENKAVFAKKEVSKQSVKDLKHILDGIENLEALKEAIANQIQW